MRVVRRLRDSLSSRHSHRPSRHSRTNHWGPRVTSFPPTITSFPRRRESGHACMPPSRPAPRPSSRHSRGHHVIPAKAGIWMRGTAASVDVGPLLRRLPRRPGAKERRACSDKEAAGKEEQEQQAARYACAASSGELVGGNGRRGGRGRRSGDGRAGWGHGWRGRGSGRPGCYDVI